ncbi:hypothetical protein CHS0354_016011 [Potamilus streckersoni]|uniref:Uncharacterized protein n=1 Tax=Potamilus streckersoni TaxID=2493646 RepID=A0AAE0SY99_9BIVA|nr:hypothetical protein CHS0354_016011 [Potamilus streckersoni]
MFKLQKLQFIRWLMKFLERCTAVIANRNAMHDFNEQQRKKVRDYIMKLNGDLRKFQVECQSKCKELKSQRTKAITKVKAKLKSCLDLKIRKPFQWLAEDIPTRRQGEAWSDYKERLNQKIIQRIDDTIMNDDGVKGVCEEYHESHKDMLEQLSTKFKDLESRMSLHGPCRAIDEYDQEKQAFLYRLLAPLRKLFIILKDILDTNRVLKSCYSEDEFSSDRIRYMITQTEEVVSFYVNEMQLQSTATAIVENIWDSVEKTINCFVACTQFRDKCLVEIFDSELDKKTLEYWRDQFLLPELDKCSKVYISMVMKHEIDQSKLEIDRDDPSSRIAQGGFASILKGKLKEENRELEIAVKIVRRPASDCDTDIFRECFLLRYV